MKVRPDLVGKEGEEKSDGCHVIALEMVEVTSARHEVNGKDVHCAGKRKDLGSGLSSFVLTDRNFGKW